MIKYTYLSIIICAALLFGSCKRFLDVKPKGTILPTKVEDFEGLLNAPSMTRTFPINLLDFSDDNYNTFDATAKSPTANGYYWRSILTLNQNADPDVWGPLYKTIYSSNVVISGVPTATGSTEPHKNQVIAEAKLIRAFCYLDLLTVFAKAYNPQTAAADLGVPIVVSTNMGDKTPARSTLKQNMDMIIQDAKDAVGMLPAVNINKYRPSKFAAYGLLTRAYLYMGDYNQAALAVNEALKGEHQLLNYNAYSSVFEMPVYDLSPEVLWQRAAVSGSPIFMLYSAELKSAFTNDDLRYSYLTITNQNGLGRTGLLGEYSFGITYPEMYLTKAELLARAGQVAEAMKLVNLIRKNRIETATYTDQTASGAEDAIEKVLMERKRELAYGGLRWFDMKRLDREGRMPTVKRINPETKEVLAELKPGGANYTFEIPPRVSMFNPDMILNFK
jgi:tetratricopeptide (TPR) repeat protein